MKHFTVEEAESLLPRLEGLMREIQTLKRLIQRRLSNWRRRQDHSEPARAVAQGQIDFLAAQINQRLDELVQWGCQPKDLEAGLVDFPARLDGREINLCWKLGEKRIDHWHGLEEGFPGRKPLPASMRSAPPR